MIGVYEEQSRAEARATGSTKGGGEGKGRARVMVQGHSTWDFVVFRTSCPWG